jgi:hypothetical protein
MVIERTKKEIITKTSIICGYNWLQSLIDYLTYKEATSKSKSKQSDIDNLAKESKKGWWEKIESDLLNENCC